MPTMLLNLPVEIIREICLCLVADGVKDEHPFWEWEENPDCLEARRALSRLSQTCSIMRAIGQPELFRGCGQKSDQKLLLLQTVIRRPALAQFVECLNLQLAGDAFFARGGFGYPIQCDLLKLEDTPVEAAIRGLKIDFADEWIERLRYDKNGVWNPIVFWDGLLALYLAFFPVLTTLSFKWPGEHAMMVNNLLAQAPRLIPSWYMLRTLNIIGLRTGNRGESAYRRFNGATKILTWPTLRSLRIKDFDITSMSSLPLLPSLSLTRLRLSGGVVTFAAQRAFLNSPKALEHFEFYRVDSKSSDGGNDIQYTTRLVEDLSAHASSLQSLTLVLGDPYAWLSPKFHELERRFHIASLKNFFSLKTLTIDTLCIWYSLGERQDFFLNFLPSSICDLELVNVADRFYVWIVEPFASCLEEFPLLKQVTIDASDNCHSEYEKLAPAFMKRDVIYTVKKGNSLTRRLRYY